MRDKDSQLIFESYDQKVLINEAFPVLLLITALAPIAAYISGKIGLTGQFVNWLKRATNGLIDIKEWEETTPYQIASFFDITGLSAWPTVDRLTKEYEKNPTDQNLFELWLSIGYALPVLGKFTKLLKAAQGAKNAEKALPLIYKLGIKLIEKFIKPLFENQLVKDAILKLYTKSQSEVIKRSIVNFLGMIGVRWASKSFFASLMTSASGDKKEATSQPYTKDGITIMPRGEKKSTPESAKPSPTPYDF